MAQKSLQQQFPVDRTTRIDDVWLRALLGVLESRIGGIEAKGADYDASVQELLAVGLTRINEYLIPAIEKIRDLTELGFLVASSQTSALLVQDAVTVFNVPPGTQRDLFVPSSFVSLTRESTIGDYAIMRTLSYNQETGDYTGQMISVMGGPGPFSDWEIGAVAGSTIAQIDMLLESQAIRDEIGEFTDDAVSAAGIATTKAGEVATTAIQVLGYRDEVEQDRLSVVAALSQFFRTYWGRRTTPPPTTGENAALGGAFYVDISITPNRLKTLDENGAWQFAIPTDIYSKTETDGRYLRKDGLQSLTPAEKGQAVANIGGGVLSGLRNKIINGGMAIAQRTGGSSTGSGFCADRWFSIGHSLQAVVPLTEAERAITGFDVKNILTLYVNAAGTITVSQGMEGVETLAGEKATLTLYVKGAAANMPFSAQLKQNFGTGGSPSAVVNTPIPLSITTLPLGLTKITALVDVPPITGKTLGTNGNDCLYLVLTRGSGVDGNLSFTKVSFVKGDATKEDDPSSPRHIQQETALCLRYFETNRMNKFFFGNAGNVLNDTIMPTVLKRAIPNVLVSAIAYNNTSGLGIQTVERSRFTYVISIPATGPAELGFTWTADSEL